MKKLMITYCDEKYLKWYPVWLKSIKIFEPEADTILHLINHKMKKNRTIIHHTISILNPDVIICHKIKFFIETIEKYDADIYILTDIDMMLNKPLVEFDNDENWDIAGFLIRENKVAGGILGARKTEKALIFLNEYNNYLIKPPYFFNKDQPSLAMFYNKYNGNLIKWKQLSRKYIDHTCSDDAFFWSAHKSSFGSKEQRLEKFIKRLKQYEDMFTYSSQGRQ